MKLVTSVKSVSKVLFLTIYIYIYIYHCITNLQLLHNYWKAKFCVLQKAGSSF